MTSTRTFRHDDYELLCGANPIDSGRFVPSLVVAKQSWPKRPRVIAMERGDYSNEETAIDAAHAQGIAWITNYG